MELGKVRKNGCQLPWHPRQCFLWVFFFLAIVSDFFVLLPVLPNPWQTTGFICMGVIFFIHLVTHALVVLIDPSCGDTPYSWLNPLKCTWDGERSRLRIERLQRLPGRTHHCRSCNKDVEGHDHHCFWINTCVSARNYRFYFVCVLTGFLIVVQLVLTSSYIILVDFVQPHLRGEGTLSQTAPMLINAGSSSALLLLPLESAGTFILFVAYATLGFAMVATIFLGLLLSCHIYLFVVDKSTYEFVLGWMERFGLRKKPDVDVEAFRAEVSNQP